MKLCLKILSVPLYMFNGLEHTTILSHFLTFIAGSSSRLLRILTYLDQQMYVNILYMFFFMCPMKCIMFVNCQIH